MGNKFLTPKPFFHTTFFKALAIALSVHILFFLLFTFQTPPTDSEIFLPTAFFEIDPDLHHDSNLPFNDYNLSQTLVPPASHPLAHTRSQATAPPLLQHTKEATPPLLQHTYALLIPSFETDKTPAPQYLVLRLFGEAAAHRLLDDSLTRLRAAAKTDTLVPFTLYRLQIEAATGRPFQRFGEGEHFLSLLQLQPSARHAIYTGFAELLLLDALPSASTPDEKLFVLRELP